MKLLRLNWVLIGALLLTGAIFLPALASDSPDKESSGKGWLGVYIQDIEDDMSEALNLKSKKGVLVGDVINDSPAEKGGIKSGDIIVKFNGKSSDDENDLRESIASTKPGEEAQIVVLRDGKEKTFSVEMGESDGASSSFGWNDDNGRKSITKVLRFDDNDNEDHAGLGIRIDNLSEQLGNYFGVKDGQGVLITEVLDDSPAKKSGITAGDVIIKADGKDVENTDMLRDIISDKKDGDKVVLMVKRNKQDIPITTEVSEKFSFSGKQFFGAPMGRTYAFEMPPMPEVQINMDELRKSVKELKEQMKELKRELKKEFKNLEID
ncbi:MAG: hypothetical protein CO189_11895 [candidate division Zixibacteria bacterium CG_4_9_14_3_um_filter_46_8]|nr:MAG: hypothetical protein CO189_11895 [candidate division Zixibacteria bacterium CG_4_9_14_3_um_filter_46_8]